MAECVFFCWTFIFCFARVQLNWMVSCYLYKSCFIYVFLGRWSSLVHRVGPWTNLRRPRQLEISLFNNGVDTNIWVFGIPVHVIILRVINQWSTCSWQQICEEGHGLYHWFYLKGDILHPVTLRQTLSLNSPQWGLVYYCFIVITYLSVTFSLCKQFTLFYMPWVP